MLEQRGIRVRVATRPAERQRENILNATAFIALKVPGECASVGESVSHIAIMGVHISRDPLMRVLTNHVIVSECKIVVRVLRFRSLFLSKIGGCFWSLFFITNSVFFGVFVCATGNSELFLVFKTRAMNHVIFDNINKKCP